MKLIAPRTLWPLLGCGVFLALAILIIPLPGIQNDEVIFAGPLYRPSLPDYSLGIGRHHVQLMIMNYSGALKTLLYLPILRVFHPSVWSLRLPVVLLCMGTIFLTWLYTRRVAGPTAAAITAILLAADPMFLLTGTIDWGPVALQHFLLMSGLVSLLKWVDGGPSSRRSLGWLALAFFAWGLGFWDKALFFWPISGLAVAVLCIYPRQLFARIRLPEVAVALGALLLGAFPLIAYNAMHRGATVKSNSNFSLEDSETKVEALRNTLQGTILFDIFSTNPVPHDAAPLSAWERASQRLAQVAGDHHRTGFLWGVGSAIVLGIFAVSWRERRQMMFLLLAMAIGFFEMLITVARETPLTTSCCSGRFPLCCAPSRSARLPRRAFACCVTLPWPLSPFCSGKSY